MYNFIGFVECYFNVYDHISYNLGLKSGKKLWMMALLEKQRHQKIKKETTGSIASSIIASDGSWADIFYRQSARPHYRKASSKLKGTKLTGTASWMSQRRTRQRFGQRPGWRSTWWPGRTGKTTISTAPARYNREGWWPGGEPAPPAAEMGGGGDGAGTCLPAWGLWCSSTR
jgi:hypothetical protein